MFTIDFVLQEDDFVALTRHYMKSSSTYSRQVMGLAAGSGLVGAAIGLGIFSSDGMTGGSVAGAVVLGVLTGLMIPWILRRTYLRSIRKLVRRDAAAMLGPARIILDGVGVRESTPRNSTNVPWHGVRAVSETDDHVFIHLTRTTAFVIPKRGMEAAIPQLRANVPAHLWGAELF